MQAVISCENISVKYESVLAVKDVSFSLNQGDYLCIVGENGTGKSTLVKALLGLIKPSAGNVRLSGLKQTQIGYLPQQTAVQNDFPASVFEVVLSGCLNRHGILAFYTKKDRETAKNNIQLLGIHDIKDNSFRDLSGGQQQRVLLARALCATDKLLLLDEPASGLDPLMVSEMYSSLDMLNKRGLTIIMVSHDVERAIQYGNKILHMDTIVSYFGNRDDYITTPLYKRMTGGVYNA